MFFIITILALFADYIDVVYLKNGSIIRGIIIENVPNDSIKLKTSDGSIFVFSYDEIIKFTKEEVEQEAKEPAEEAEEIVEIDNEEAFRKLNQILLTDTALKQPMAYKELADQLSMEQKMNLLNTFERKKSTAAVACILNSTIGFGIGSFIQRDFKWAVPMLIMDIIADSCYIAGSLNLYYWDSEWDEDEDEWDDWYYIEEWAVALLISGVSLRTTTWVMGLVRPIVYVKRYNRNLNSLLGGERMNVIFTPHVNFNENKYGVAINFTY